VLTNRKIGKRKKAARPLLQQKTVTSCIELCIQHLRIHLKVNCRLDLTHEWIQLIGNFLIIFLIVAIAFHYKVKTQTMHIKSINVICTQHHCFPFPYMYLIYLISWRDSNPDLLFLRRMQSPLLRCQGTMYIDC
jgi:hypothetical protein